MVLSNEIISDIGRSGVNLWQALIFIFKGKVDLGDTAIQIQKAGIGSIFIVAITAAFIGLAMSTQLAKELFNRYGAEQLVGGLVAIAIVRELAPVITSIVVAGRVGAAISAEIGSMKVSEQIDALEVLGINPIKYLLVPRLLAAAIVSPLLTVMSALIAILSGMILTRATVNLNFSVYLDSVRTVLEMRDIFIMMLKSLIFGSAISIIATTTGLIARGGAEAVGNGATKTVVWSIILIFTFNYIITSIFFGV
ncbi:MAG: ABC transporter permease [Candidatus Gastranaerophilales bacterium]|nr:ABC transporter permease [Candidatus Gastranaerophilales bacterium]